RLAAAGPRLAQAGAGRQRLQPLPQLPPPRRAAERPGPGARDELVRLQVRATPMGLHELQTVPEDVRHATEVIAGLDRCFLVGFGRLGPEQAEALQALRRICTGTPLERPVGTAVEALGRNEFVEAHFVALAAARAAIQGAQYDALRAQAARALGRPAEGGAADGPPAGEAGEVPGPVRVWQESTRHWLMELALAGFKQLEDQTLAPFAATLEQIQGEP